MKNLIIIMSLSLLLFTGCNSLTSAQQEATEAIQNITNEAIRIKTNATNTATQVKEAVDSVNQAMTEAQEAVDAIHEATTDIQSIGDNPDDEASLSSEDQSDSAE